VLCESSLPTSNNEILLGVPANELVGMISFGLLQRLELGWRWPFPLCTGCTLALVVFMPHTKYSPVSGTQTTVRAAVPLLTSSIVGSGRSGCANLHEAESALHTVVAIALHSHNNEL
jgi:hypothetical protein